MRLENPHDLAWDRVKTPYWELANWPSRTSRTMLGVDPTSSDGEVARNTRTARETARSGVTQLAEKRSSTTLGVLGRGRSRFRSRGSRSRPGPRPRARGSRAARRGDEPTRT